MPVYRGKSFIEEYHDKKAKGLMPLTPLDKGYQLIYPTAMDANEQQCIKELEPKQQGEMPDRLRFPAPEGKEGSCGCLMTQWEADGVRLETLWQPLWDTQVLTAGTTEMSFFQNPAGRSTTQTNVPTAGQLTWPKKFHLWELSLHIGSGHLEQFIQGQKDRLREHFLTHVRHALTVTVRIGEKDHLKIPLEAMFNPREGEYRAAICNPLFFPSVQNFLVFLSMDRPFFDPNLNHKIRCVLHGYLHREIP